MAVSLDLPDEARERLEAEAARRGVTIDEVVTELASHLPAHVNAANRRRRFVAIGASGRTEPLDIRRERAELAARKHARGA